MEGNRLPIELHKIPLSQFSASSQKWFKETLKNDVLEFFTGPDKMLRIRNDKENKILIEIKYEEYISYKIDDFINRLINYTNNGLNVDFIKLNK